MLHKELTVLNRRRIAGQLPKSRSNERNGVVTSEDQHRL